GALQVLACRHGGGRVVGIVEIDELRAAPRVGRDLLELEQERGARREGVAVRLAARQHRAALVNGVARLWYDRDVTSIDERRREVRDPLLRADQRVQLGEGIEARAEASLHVGRGGLAERRQPELERVATHR